MRQKYYFYNIKEEIKMLELVNDVNEEIVADAAEALVGNVTEEVVT